MDGRGEPRASPIFSTTGLAVLLKHGLSELRGRATWEDTSDLNAGLRPLCSGLKDIFSSHFDSLC